MTDKTINDLDALAALTGSEMAEVQNDDGSFKVPLASFGHRLILNPPAASDFPTWANQDSATLDELADGLSVAHAAQSGADSMHMRVRSLPGGSAWTLVIGCKAGFPFKNYHWGGLVLRESGTGKVINFGFGNPSHGVIIVQHWNSPSSYVDDNIGIDMGTAREGFFKVALAGGTLTFSHSIDGVTWTDIFSQALATNFTTGPDQWGFGVNPNNQGNPQIGGRLDVTHWSEG